MAEFGPLCENSTSQLEKSQHSVREVSVVDNSIESKALLGDLGQLVIFHREEEYRLRITGKGKLILNK